MRGSIVVVILSFLLIVGCQKKSDTVKVSGRVLIDNQPLAGGHVLFRAVGADGKPDPTKEAAGETDKEGHFALQRLQDKSSGAAPGNYRVEIHAVERSSKGIRERIPPQYNKQSKLTYTVPPEGTAEANFEIKGK